MLCVWVGVGSTRDTNLSNTLFSLPESQAVCVSLGSIAVGLKMSGILDFESGTEAVE